MSGPAPKLYVLPGSHPCAAVEAALKLKMGLTGGVAARSCRFVATGAVGTGGRRG